jgi:predicted  nucleic acid-binding Zn-ribbon protein
MHPSMDEWPADAEAAAVPKVRRAPPDLHDEAELPSPVDRDDAANILVRSGPGRIRPIAVALSAAVLLAGFATAGLFLYFRSASLDDDYHRLASSLSELESQVARTGDSVRGIEDQVAAVSGRLPQLERSATGSAAQIELLWNEAAEARAGLSGLTGQDGAVARIGAQVGRQRAELEKLVGGLQADVTAARADQARLDKALQALAPLPDKLASQRSDFARQIETVSRQSAEDRSEIARLKAWAGEAGTASAGGLAALQQQQDELSRKIGELETSVAADRSGVADIRQRVEDPVHGIAQVAATLERQRAELSNEIADMRRALDINVTAITLLQHRLAAPPLSVTVPKTPDAEPPPQQERATAAAATPPAATASAGAPADTASTESSSRPAATERTDATAGATPAAPPRIVLRMVASREARTHARELQARLRAKGLRVERAGRVRTDARSSTVTYFHDGDQASADDVAAEVASGEARRGDVPAGARPPPPGTIEVLLVR